MTRFTPQSRAVAIATLVVLSVVAGSVTFAGPADAVTGKDTISSIDTNPVTEGTTNSHDFNYSFTGVNTSGETTLTFAVPGEFVIEDHDVEMKNASGAVLNTTTQVGDELRVTATPTTTTVYLAGTVELTVPEVPQDRDYTLKINATDNDGKDQYLQDTLTVENSDLTVSQIQRFAPRTVDQQTENRHTFNYSFTEIDSGDSTDYSISVPNDFTVESYDLTVENASGETLTSQSGSGSLPTLSTTSTTGTVYFSGSVNLTSPAVREGQENETYTDGVTISASDNDRSTSTAEDLTVEYVGGQPGDPEFLSAIQYKQSDGTPAVEVAFSEDVQNFDASNYDLYVEGEGELSSEIVSVNEAQGRAVIELDDTYSSKMTLRLGSGITDPDGNALTNPGNETVTFAPTSVGAGDPPLSAYKGANISVVASASNTGVTIEGVDDGNNYFFPGSTGTNSRIFIFRTSNQELGEYEADIAGEGTATITVRGLNLDISIEDRNVSTLSTIQGTVSARASNREVRLEFLDDDGDSVESVSDRLVTLSGQGEYEFSYDVEEISIDPGEYQIRATDTTSGITVTSDAITVREAGDLEATFPQSTVTEARGDVVAIPIELANTREGTLTIGGDDVGYEVNVTVRDAGGNDRDNRVTVYFNTYAATSYGTGSFSSENDLIQVSEDDEIVRGEVTTGVSNLLDAELYPLEASIDGRLTDVSQIDLRPRETIAIRTWTAPRNRYGDLDAPEDVREGTDEEWVTRDSRLAFGDAVVYEVQATGLEGALDARGEDTVTSEFYDFADGSKGSPRAQFTVEQQDPGPNRDPLVLELNASNSRVIADSENDTYYVVTRTGEFGPSGVRDTNNNGAIDGGENDYGSIDAEDDLRAYFTVFGDDENDLDLTESGDDETVETTHSLTQAELSMNEPFNVTAASGQEVFGEATVAPGTELNIRVRSADGVRPAFLKTATTTVDADGQFLVTLSFNDTEPGDGYTITVSDASGPASELEVDGTVQDVIPTATSDTPEETTVDTTTTTTTATPTDTTSTPTAGTTTTEIPTVRTPTTTPGFGVAASLVALAAAALLALRRGSE